ncbi:MAG: hypothetical protein ABI134_00325 [Byssovorax sp.]
MHSRPSRPAREGGLLRLLVISASFVAAIAPASAALAQGAPPPAKPPPAGAPPTKGTDLELDLDAPKSPEPEKKEEPPPLPPAEADAWGVGGKDEEGTYAPGKKKKVTEVDDDKTPRVLGPPAAVSLDMLVGLGAMRDVTNDSGVTDLTVLSFVFGLQYRFGESLTIGARFPYSTGSIKGPGGAADDYNTFAIGNLELRGRYAFNLTRRISLPVELALYFPSASGDLFADANDQGARAQALVNQAAAYSRGFEENPLFASKRMGIRIGAGVAYDKNEIHVEGHTRLDIMGKTGGNEPVAAELHTPNTTWLTGASFFYDFFGGKLTPGLRAWLAVTTLPLFAGTRDYSGAQLVLEPDITTRIPLNAAGSLAVRGGLGYVIPVAGALGGGQKIGADNSGSTGGLRVHAEFQF